MIDSAPTHPPRAPLRIPRQVDIRIPATLRGHADFGAAQLIYRFDDSYMAASERRRDSHAVGF